MAMDLSLTAVERDYLLNLLREELGRLKAEIHRTEAAGFKDQLKADETVLQGLIARLESDQAA
jgi:hypothetical protein